MPYKEKEIQKVYWTISDISKELKIPTSMIRYWCSEIPIIRHSKRNKNSWKMFDKKSRDLIHDVYLLVKVKRYTIEGARLELNNDNRR